MNYLVNLASFSEGNVKIHSEFLSAFKYAFSLQTKHK